MNLASKNYFEKLIIFKLIQSALECIDMLQLYMYEFWWNIPIVKLCSACTLSYCVGERCCTLWA